MSICFHTLASALVLHTAPHRLKNWPVPWSLSCSNSVFIYLCSINGDCEASGGIEKCCINTALHFPFISSVSPSCAESNTQASDQGGDLALGEETPH